MAYITHYSERNAKAIDARRLDGPAAWRENFDGTAAEAAAHVSREYGRPGRREGNAFHYVGFVLYVEADR